jgi:amidohydrolase
MSLNEHQSQIIAAVEAAAEQIISVSHQIHARPELGYDEVFASRLLTETLEGFGFTVERGFAGIPTAFRARKGNPGGVKIAFLAEYDALPEIGHGCGHNVIATSALGAGVGLGAVITELAGEVWVVGTPAEETDGGKVVMVNRHAFDEVDAAMMVHPHGGNYYLTESLAMDAIQVDFFGKPSHAAAAPWEGLNALDAILLTFNNLNALRQQIRPDARIHGIITHGGVAPNIIPEFTQAKFYIRAKQRGYLNRLVEQFKDCAQAAALATGTRAEIKNYENSFDDMVNNLALAGRFREIMTGELGAPAFERAPEHYGSIDMGNVSHVAPGIHVLVDIGAGQPLTPHTREFCDAAASPFADQTLLRAGKGLALTGYEMIVDSNFREHVRAEFNQQRGSV